ncbi:apoptotic chromatin condensation inducer in the nucleus isoform X1 [Thunnus albacares]|uniref:apoptotic chromatin condensation inducer in the nucleus isoform X1 n=1 Tax=Thunnus albacares TaxID=8236 RepID=UPI001CF67A44|nr:apoptotic chromatin condensation inducer in the nucleus isoform X1 [Thunnus albacares]
MADLEDVTLDGRPLQSLRVADLKAALEERGLSKSGQKNALIKRLKGALMLENLQRTSTAHIGLQPNSQIGEEMSQNSFIKQYLAKQQELLRQRLEREAREAYETNDQEDHTEVNNSTSGPPQAQDVAPVLADQHKPPGPSGGEGLYGAANEGEGNGNQEANMSGPPASGSVPLRVQGGEHRPERGAASSDFAADSDDDDSEDGEEDGDDEDWDSNVRRRSIREPARGPTTRERSGASCQPQQQHIPSLLSPQLRQPTPPPSPPPELSFPLPDTPKQSPPSPDVAPARRSSSSSSSGSSSSGSRSSSPEPQRSGHAERKPGPLTLLARKMESEGAFSGAGWHGGNGEGDRQDSSLPSATLFPGRGPPEGLVSAITHTANTAGHVAFPMIPGTNQGVTGANSARVQVPVSVLKATATEERDRERDSEIEREKALELERQEKQRKLEQERALEVERERALALERERALEQERFERQQALEREEREKALQLERELALERERQEREQALAKEREEREQALARERALELERQKELERQRALEQERLQREREERERREREEMELERAKALEREREEREKALEQERLERERALEAERKEKERIEREKALEQERLERERLEREKALEQERIERERALEQERIEREKALEQKRIEREKAIEQERLERERVLEQERLEREKALEREREKALERERIEREKALERERIEKEKALEQERIEKEKALEQERLERERAQEKERLELERKEKERLAREKALEQERLEREKALQREREEKEKAEREAALEQERKEKERAEKERKERLERERVLEQQKLERERERLEREKAMQKEKEEQERALEQEKERARMAEKERESHLPPSKRGREIGLTSLPTPPPLSTGPGRKSSTEAGAQEDAHAPMSQSEAQAAEAGAPMSSTPLSPQSSFKKFRFLRDSAPTQPQSSTSMVIKRPRTFSDSPQPQASPISSLTNVGERQQEGHQPFAEQKDSARQEVAVAGAQGSVRSQSEEETAVSTTLRPKEEGATSLGTENKDKAGSVATEQAAKESTKKAKDVDEGKGPSSPVDAAQRRGRDAKKEEKHKRQRSSSNDSSSSESDSGSSSSGSSGSSSSSQEKTCSTSRGRKEGKPERDSSPQHRVTVEAQAEGVKETPKASTCKREMSVEKSNTTADGASRTEKLFTDAPTREETKRKRKDSEEEEEKKDKQRQVMESAMAEPEKLPETSEETPKAFSARKISLSSSKLSPGTGSAEGEQDSGAAAGRKRRWGSSTAVTAKKPSISITTDSLKSLIPDIRPCIGQEAVVDLHPEEAVLSGAEDEERERSDQDLQIRRTVTQVVHSESQENGQKEAKRSRCEEMEEDDLQGDGERTGVHEEKMDTSFPAAMETQSPSHTSHDVEINTVTASDTLIRRSISQQKTGVSITIDDPVRTARQPSPPRGKVSNIVHVCNLVRPFTLGQLKELLSRTGTLVEDGFWIDKIKSHCYVTYSSSEEAVTTRAALHGVKWPQSNPKVLSVDFCQQDELDFHKGLGAADRPGAEEQGPGSGRGRASGLPSLLPERDQWAEREREMERRERARAEREWDRDKVREFGKPGEEKEGGPRRSRSRERRRKERGKSKEKKTEKKEKTAEDPPAKLLDDLFRKTKAAPCIYWLPLTEEQFVQREAARAERMKEREKRRKEQEEEEEEKKREEERKERMKASGGTTGDRSEGEKDKDRDRERDRDRDRGRDRDREKERERERERENDKRRDSYRRPGGSRAGGGRRSRSRSDPRERRR